MEACQSCSMPVEAGPYCVHCVDESGALQAFDVRFAAMLEYAKRKSPERSTEELEERTLAYMRTMPAWKDHPGLSDTRGRGTDS